MIDYDSWQRKSYNNPVLGELKRSKIWLEGEKVNIDYNSWYLRSIKKLTNNNRLVFVGMMDNGWIGQDDISKKSKSGYLTCFVI